MLGKTISHYKIIEKLGQGGMGEVYLAEDSRLDRKVALKILPQHLSDRAELRERFEREARAVSSLNHPHICTLHDIGEQDGIHYLVMEHLVGETLEARLEKGALPLEQTLEYAIQIADALDKAHRQGVVHRDLKPGNIMLVKSGAKLLDFGLAKLQAAETPTNLSALPTEQANLTAEGTILGTLQYMAPEQLEGKEADGRTDIFAFGAVVYEMATGKKAFEGKSQASLIAAIMEKDPPAMAELQPMTPQLLDWVVKRCLAKEPDERVQSAADLMAELRLVSEVGTPVGPSPSVTGPAAWKRAIPWGIAGVVIVLAAVAIWNLTRPAPLALKRFAVTPPLSATLADSALSAVAISPDEKYLVYMAEGEGTTQLYMRPLDDLTAKPLPGTEGTIGGMFFSPDGESVAFGTRGELKRVSLKGGAAVTLCEASGFFGGSWGPDGAIVFSATVGAGRGLYSVSATGGDSKVLAIPDRRKAERMYQDPLILPDGKSVLFDVRGATFQINALRLDTGESKMVVEGGILLNYAPTGHLLYVRPEAPGTLLAVPFDLERLEVTGGSAPVLQEIRNEDLAISKTGTLVYVPGGDRVSLAREFVWVDHEGKATPFKEMERTEQPRVSPEGQRVALLVPSGSTWGEIFVYDLARDTLRRLTFDGVNHTVVWTPDGERVVFVSHKDGPGNIFWTPADGSGQVELLFGTENDQWPGSFSPDGQLLALVEDDPETGFDIWTLSMNGDRKPEPFQRTSAKEWGPLFSPDGRWITYVSNESGRDEVYVQPYPKSPGKWQISNDGGRDPVWSPDGDKLFYRNGDKMMAVVVTNEPSFTPDKPELLFEGEYSFHAVPGWLNNDISVDGQKFLMIRSQVIEESSPTQINVVLNWFEELNRLVPTDN